MMLVVSCGSSDDGSEANCSPEWFTMQSERIGDAILNYSMNQSEENCKAYVEVLSDWLDAASQCDGVSQADIDETRESLEELECD